MDGSEDEGPVITGDRRASQAASLSEESPQGGKSRAPQAGKKRDRGAKAAPKKAAAGSAGSRKRQKGSAAEAAHPQDDTLPAPAPQPAPPVSTDLAAAATMWEAVGGVVVVRTLPATQALAPSDGDNEEPSGVSKKARRVRPDASQSQNAAEQALVTDLPSNPLPAADGIGGGLPAPNAAMEAPMSPAKKRKSSAMSGGQHPSAQPPSLVASPLGAPPSPAPMAAPAHSIRPVTGQVSVSEAPREESHAPAASNLSKQVSELQQHFEAIDQEQLLEEEVEDKAKGGNSRRDLTIHPTQAAPWADIYDSAGAHEGRGRVGSKVGPDPLGSAVKAPPRGPSRFKALSPQVVRVDPIAASPVQLPDLDLRVDEADEEDELDLRDRVLLALTTFSDSQQAPAPALSDGRHALPTLKPAPVSLHAAPAPMPAADGQTRTKTGSKGPMAYSPLCGGYLYGYGDVGTEDREYGVDSMFGTFYPYRHANNIFQILL